jgi:hypothetical protein
LFPEETIAERPAIITTKNSIDRRIMPVIVAKVYLRKSFIIRQYKKFDINIEKTA